MALVAEAARYPIAVVMIAEGETGASYLACKNALHGVNSKVSVLRGAEPVGCFRQIGMAHRLRYFALGASVRSPHVALPMARTAAAPPLGVRRVQSMPECISKADTADGESSGARAAFMSLLRDVAYDDDLADGRALHEVLDSMQVAVLQTKLNEVCTAHHIHPRALSTVCTVC